MRLPPLKAGIYRHYKGHHYQVIGYGHDANADTLMTFAPHSEGSMPQPLGERMVVLYIGLELSDAHRGPRWSVRTVDDFLAYVDPTDGSVVPQSVVEACQGSVRQVEAQGYVPRFQYEGPQWDGHDE